MNIKEQIETLNNVGVPVYSISRLDTFDNCKYEYWLRYIDKEIPQNNIYGFLGTKVHSFLERIQNGEEINFEIELNKAFDEADFLDLHFSSENVENKWKSNMLAFAKSYRPLDKKVDTEKWFLINLEGHYIQGFIDLIIYNDDGTISIVDYKTSTKYNKNDLKEKGRQLVLYAIAMEKEGYKVKDISWNFLKYANVSYKLKNGKIKNTTLERGTLLKKLKPDIIKEMQKLRLLDLNLEENIEKAVARNTFDGLPRQIKEKYTIEDCIVSYDFTEENKQETIDFICSKIEEIESHLDNKDWWAPCILENPSTFYCENLCPHLNDCEYMENILERKENSKKISEVDIELQKYLV